MRALHKLHDFITGGSIVAPLAIAFGIAIGAIVPHDARPFVLLAFAAIALIGATFEPIR